MRVSGNEASSEDHIYSYQDDILQKVSRTFALTIPQLPAELQRVVTNAYLLCRIADTIEDESALSSTQKQYFHDFFLQTVTGSDRDDTRRFAAELVPLLSRDATTAEKDLIDHTETVIAVTRLLNTNQRRALERCLGIMCRGMPDYERHASTRGLSNQASLDRYCYYVAGVVGETLTELFCDYSEGIAQQREHMHKLDVSFGEGLQMVNILKDFWEDYQRGVCWLPHNVFAEAGVDLGRISRRNHQPGFSRAYEKLIAIAHGHLRNGFEYTLLFPESEQGVRRFCLLALTLAVQTLQCIRQNLDFECGNDVKVSRRIVANTLVKVRLHAGNDRSLRRWFDQLGKGLPLKSDVIDDYWRQASSAG